MGLALGLGVALGFGVGFGRGVRDGAGVAVGAGVGAGVGTGAAVAVGVGATVGADVGAAVGGGVGAGAPLAPAVGVGRGVEVVPADGTGPGDSPGVSPAAVCGVGCGSQGTQVAPAIASVGLGVAPRTDSSGAVEGTAPEGDPVTVSSGDELAACDLRGVATAHGPWAPSRGGPVKNETIGTIAPATTPITRIRSSGRRSRSVAGYFDAGLWDPHAARIGACIVIGGSPCGVQQRVA